MSLVSAHAARAFANLLRVAGESTTATPVGGVAFAIDALVTGGSSQPTQADQSMHADAVDLTARVLAATWDAALTAQALTVRAPAQGDLLLVRGLTHAVVSARLTAGGEYRIELRAQRLTGLGAAFGPR